MNADFEKIAKQFSSGFRDTAAEQIPHHLRLAHARLYGSGWRMQKDGTLPRNECRLGVRDGKPENCKWPHH